MTLVEFLKARLKDDVRLIRAYEEYMQARAAAAGSYVPVTPPGWHPGEPFDPARMVREVEAKRQIIYDYEEYERLYNSPASNHHEVEARMLTLLRTLQWMALPHDSHPEYNESWRSDA